MILNIILIFAIMFAALQVQGKYKLASPITIITLTMLVKYIYPGFMGFVDIAVFSEEMLVFIVILVLVDAFILRLEEVKENWISLAYLAGVTVALSVLMGVTVANTIFAEYNLSVGALIALFAMCMATDPVSVVAVFQQFKLPHKLKFFAEGESLFNDAVAVIMFNAFGLFMMTGGVVTVAYAISATTQILIGSTIIGIGVGVTGIALMKLAKDVKSELLLVLLIAYTAFFLAEHTHMFGGTSPLSGLLAEIIAVLTATAIIHKSIERDKKRININKEAIIENVSNDTKRKNKTAYNLVNRFMSDITDENRHKEVGEFLGVIALLVNGVLFVSLANIINLDNMLLYWKEILSMFVVTTIIRALMMSKFAFFSNKSNKMVDINLRWFAVLLFAGIKGGLSIVMLHMMAIAAPEFRHLVMFEAIVTGVILLSVFIYVPMLMIIIGSNKEKFEKEYEAEKAAYLSY